MANSLPLFPSGAIEISFRVANTAPPKAEMEFWEAVVNAAKAFGYQSVSDFKKTDSRDMSRLFGMRFSDKVEPEVPKEEIEALFEAEA